ncbi:hypothetical protein GYN07_20860 [Rhizobium leguminosarum bv. viciae 248]|uniref:hypothetical protein n=1 Tax=Rhizobium leguminosarum TaxID=384 RepID=UPI0012BBDDE1|nr:hypothetical protein [Rhizobium leguminosarum]QHW26634.1 hypothetical protein GYN07_20860 [Rhizobium leguminosarum bv. viciae 248]
MAISASVLEAMLKAGCSAEQIVAVVRADEEANAERLAEKRGKDRIRQRNHRSRNVVSCVTECDERDLSSPEGSSPTPPSPKPLQSIPPSPPKGGSSPAGKQREAEFEREFWPIYPHKVGKPVALQAFLKARQRAPLDVIIPGLRRYVGKTDDRPWCNASTWLNQDRWEDLPAQVARGQPPPRERDLADIFNDMAKQGYHDDGRTIEGSDEHRDFDGPRQALPRLAAPTRQS